MLENILTMQGKKKKKCIHKLNYNHNEIKNGLNLGVLPVVLFCLPLFLSKRKPRK